MDTSIGTLIDFITLCFFIFFDNSTILRLFAFWPRLKIQYLRASARATAETRARVEVVTDTSGALPKFLHLMEIRAITEDNLV